MFKKLLLTGLVCLSMPVLAQQDPPTLERCDQLFVQMKAETTANPEICYPTIGDTKPFDQCYQPFDYFGERQASQVMLILDASGSMAGQVSGKSKMSIAKQQSAKFLIELAKDLPVGLIAYGHKGSSNEKDKQESCAGIEMLLPINKRRSEVAAVIDTLRPTGYTPLAGALSFAETQFSKQTTSDDDLDAVPVVYLISDGEETCDGDPVAAAKSLHESGIEATVHVIGFDVDEETRLQLEAISQAGGGKFFAAKDAKALNDHLNAALQAELSHTRYQNCLLVNEVKAITPFRQATLAMPACINRETERNFSSVLHKQIRALTGEDKNACSLELMRRTHNEKSELTKPLMDAYEELQNQQEAAAVAARQYSIDNALPPKQ